MPLELQRVSHRTAVLTFPEESARAVDRTYMYVWGILDAMSANEVRNTAPLLERHAGHGVNTAHSIAVIGGGVAGNADVAELAP